MTRTRIILLLVLALVVPTVVVLVGQSAARLATNRKIRALVEAGPRGGEEPRVLGIRHHGLGQFGHCDHTVDDNDEGLALVWWSTKDVRGERTVHLSTVVAEGGGPIPSDWRMGASHDAWVERYPRYADPDAEIGLC